MNTKLTLTIEQELMEKAEHFAREKGYSLSDIIADYLKVLTNEDKSEVTESNPIANSSKGSVKAPENIDYKKELLKRISEKYYYSE